MNETYHVVIKGKVQGVFFRATAKKTAESLGVVGWVKNTREGDVEIVCSGEQVKVKQFLEWCGLGPSQAEVKNVTINKIPEEAFSDFEIRRYN